MTPKFAKPLRRWIRSYTHAGRNAVLEHSPGWVRRVFGPAAKHMDMLFVDHGIFRVFYLNRHRLGAKAWRAAQPTPGQIRRFRRLGIKTIVNLRGERLCGSYWLETEACKRAGIELVNYKVRSRAAPSVEELHGVRELFQRIEYPMLMHCKSGADRAGLMSVLYMHLVEGQPIETAQRQLSLRFGHIKQADTGILDLFFDRYIEANKARPVDFFEWVDTVYDPVELRESFHASGMANRLVNDILRRE